jgi:hypothetical protein
VAWGTRTVQPRERRTASTSSGNGRAGADAPTRQPGATASKGERGERERERELGWAFIEREGRGESKPGRERTTGHQHH